MKIALLEPYFAGSHRAWAEGFAERSRHDVTLLTLPGRHWKWRMHGGAVSLARKFAELDTPPDLVLATDMLDLPLFLGLTRWNGPAAIYFHENQLTYPWSPDDPDPRSGRDGHFCFINYASALAADRVFFNSAFHRDAFLATLPDFLRAMPDHRELASVERIAAKSEVLSLGMDLARLDAHRVPRNEGPPLLLWNHRWEYDKNPTPFFHALFELTDAGHAFRLAVLGQDFGEQLPVFAEARERLAEHIVQWGMVEDAAEYARWLWRADILPVTSRQDFFGGSVVEAMYCDTVPLLPRRLAFPEHTDADVFYDHDDEIAPRLAQWIEQGPPVPSLREDVIRYDWSTLIERMDDAQETLTHPTR